MESMDLADSDSSGLHLTASVDDVLSSYSASYLESFLPAYQMVNQSAISGVADRYRAIKFAADASLALTATGASWSDSLGKMLVGSSEGSSLSECLSSDEAEFSRRTDAAGLSSPAASISSREQSPGLDGNDLHESSGPFDTARWGRRVGVNFVNQRNALSASGRMSVVQRLAGRGGRKAWRSRNRRLARDASRLAILRTLTSKSKGKRRTFRSFSKKPRAVVRKVKSLAKSRRRLPSASRAVVEWTGEPEQRFENGIVALQRLVPGGSSMDAAVLLDEAADFLLFLQLQVQALQSVANAVGIE